jgi:hypothetical protein
VVLKYAHGDDLDARICCRRSGFHSRERRSRQPAPEYVLCHQGESTPVNGQLPIIDAVPGEPGYSDFHVVVRVRVPATYTANSITSAAALRAAGYPMGRTTSIVNTPVVPEGSTARLRARGRRTTSWPRCRRIPATHHSGR